eukprot:TRINITY_DN9102_c1_g1_i1.p1 TRINITY_DN9102_c1_g1~~TRINITY_DN9102_c1_g1_i1.p1  ORF type:complete len:238 (+),score=17.88 TRINITY_DN9102_c1_g1_i1:91-804(+)
MVPPSPQSPWLEDTKVCDGSILLGTPVVGVSPGSAETRSRSPSRTPVLEGLRQRSGLGEARELRPQLRQRMSTFEGMGDAVPQVVVTPGGMGGARGDGMCRRRDKEQRRFSFWDILVLARKKEAAEKPSNAATPDIGPKPPVEYTSPCRAFRLTGLCQWGARCRFPHVESEHAPPCDAAVRACPRLMTVAGQARDDCCGKARRHGKLSCPRCKRALQPHLGDSISPASASEALSPRK